MINIMTRINSEIIFNKNGLGLIEVIVAVFLTSIAILAMFSLVSPSWKSVGRSDYLGRATGILHSKLIQEEARIMNPCCIVTNDIYTSSVNTSGQASSVSGDLQFNVTTTVANIANDTWRVSVRVTWPNHPGISESIVIIRQDSFVYPLTCTGGSFTCI